MLTNMFKDYSDLLHIKELCPILDIIKNTVYQILNTGELKAFINID